MYCVGKKQKEKIVSPSKVLVQKETNKTDAEGEDAQQTVAILSVTKQTELGDAQTHVKGLLGSS